MGKMERPDYVRKAIVENDHEALSEMGKKGGPIGTSHRVQLNDFRKAEFREGAAENAELSPLSEDGDVLPPEPKITEPSEEK